MPWTPGRICAAQCRVLPDRNAVRADSIATRHATPAGNTRRNPKPVTLSARTLQQRTRLHDRCLLPLHAQLVLGEHHLAPHVVHREAQVVLQHPPPQIATPPRLDAFMDQTRSRLFDIGLRHLPPYLSCRRPGRRPGRGMPSPSPSAHTAAPWRTWLLLQTCPGSCTQQQ